MIQRGELRLPEMQRRHVHVIGAASEAVFDLHCPDGPPGLRENLGFNRDKLNSIATELAGGRRATYGAARPCGRSYALRLPWLVNGICRRLRRVRPLSSALCLTKALELVGEAARGASGPCGLRRVAYARLRKYLGGGDVKKKTMH
jgi:hypothetical protein